MPLVSKKSLFQALLMPLFLALAGVVVYYFTDAKVFWPGFIAMLFFYALIFFVGAQLAGKQAQKAEGQDLLLAGRKLPLWIAIFTMSATWIGGGYINGTAEYTHSSGLVWVQAPWGYALSLIIGGLFFAKKMRRHRFQTMLDPLSQRYGKKTAALFFLPALAGELFWTAAILAALGSTFGLVLGLGFEESIILSAIVAIAYTALGGLMAVALTDVLQMILLFVGLLACIPFALEQVGGWEQAWSAYSSKMGASASLLPSKEALGTYYWNWWDYALLLTFGGIPWQVYFQRVLSAKDENTARNLSILAGVICLLAAIPPIMIGVIGNVFDWTSVGITEVNSKEVLPLVIKYLSPTWIATIGLGAVAAAVMSSADSSILSASSLAVWNVYKPLVKPDVKDSRIPIILKRCIAIIGISATLIALRVQSIYELWFLCSDLVYCLLFPALVMALFDPKANRYGAIAGFFVAAILRFGGGDSTLGIPIFLDYPILDAATEINAIGERTIVLFPFRTLAMLSGLVSMFVISRLTAHKTEPTHLKVVQ